MRREKCTWTAGNFGAVSVVGGDLFKAILTILSFVPLLLGRCHGGGLALGRQVMPES
jgi:hypothetical protein